MKFPANPALMEKIRKSEQASVAKKLGRCDGLREDWEKVKDAIMKEALMAKFTQHKGLMSL